MTMPEPRSDDELVSAYLDDEATPAERRRVEADPQLLDRLEAFRAVRDRLAAPLSLGPETRARLLDRAMHATVPTTGLPAAPPPPEETTVVDASVLANARRRRTALLSAAAVVALLMLVGAGVLVALSRDETTTVASSDRTPNQTPFDAEGESEQGATDRGESDDLAAEAPDGTEAPEDAGDAGPAAPSAEAAPSTTAPGGAAGASSGALVDLGDFGDRAALDAAVTAAVDAYLAEPPTGATSPRYVPHPSAGTDDPAVASCVATLTDGGGDRGQLLWVGRASEAGTPTLVLLFGAADQSRIPDPILDLVDPTTCTGESRRVPV